VPAPLCFFRFLSLDQAEWLHPNSEVQRGPLPELATQVSNVRLILIAPGKLSPCTGFPCRAENELCGRVPYLTPWKIN
jgi:hypothetical protein